MDIRIPSDIGAERYAQKITDHLQKIMAMVRSVAQKSTKANGFLKKCTPEQHRALDALLQKMEVEPQDAKDIDESPSTLAIASASSRHPSVAMPFQPEDVHCTLQNICM